ncbi:MAG: hypothetical protein Q8O38_17145 [Sulfurimicrobium sp.]|nr:hypothetical protein [Sulfurimicrobium sp.]
MVLQAGVPEPHEDGEVAQQPPCDEFACPAPSEIPALNVEFEPEQQPPEALLAPAPTKTPALKVEFEPEQQPPDGVLLHAFSNNSGKAMSGIYLNMSGSLMNPFLI